MSNNNNSLTLKYCIITSTVSILFIAISLIPVSKKAIFWNRCLNQTVKWINEKEGSLKGWNKEAIESLSVAVCNGAVYEPKFKPK